MVFVPSPSVAQVEVRGTLEDQQVENVLYFLDKAPPITPAKLQSLANDIRGVWIAQFLPWLTSRYIFREVYAVDLSTATSATATAPADGQAGSRSITAGMLPNQCTICISFRTNQRGRSARGRNYWAGISHNDSVGNNITATLRNGIVSAYEGLLALTEDDTIPWYWVVLSRRANGAWRPQGLTNTITSVLIIDNVIDSQRRRMPGRGA